MSKLNIPLESIFGIHRKNSKNIWHFDYKINIRLEFYKLGIEELSDCMLHIL